MGEGHSLLAVSDDVPPSLAALCAIPRHDGLLDSSVNHICNI